MTRQAFMKLTTVCWQPLSDIKLRPAPRAPSGNSRFTAVFKAASQPVPCLVLQPGIMASIKTLVMAMYHHWFSLDGLGSWPVG